LARNLAVNDSSFATKVVDAASEYHVLCTDQHTRLICDSIDLRQSQAAFNEAHRLLTEVGKRAKKDDFAAKIEAHSSKDPVTGICDAILVTPCSGGATAILQGTSSSDEHEELPKSFMLVQGPMPEKLDASEGKTSHQIKKAVTRRPKSKSNKSLVVPAHAPDASGIRKADQRLLQNPFLYYSDGNPATQTKETMPSKNTSSDEPTRGTDILLPLLIAEYKKKDTSGISTATNQMRIYQVSAVTFLSALGITDQPVFGLVVNGTLGAVTMAWKTKDVCAASVYHF
jgi:hypothetical protein